MTACQPLTALSPERIFGACCSVATTHLIEERFKRSSLELLAALRVLQDRGLTRLAEAEGLLRNLSAKHFTRVWSAPDAYLWTRLAYGFAKSGLADNFVSKFAKWSGLSATTFEQGLADRAILIALSGHAIVGNAVRLDTPASLLRIGSMAGAPIAWMLTDDLRLFGADGGRLLVGSSPYNAPFCASSSPTARATRSN
jgi:hypothetical protein